MRSINDTYNPRHNSLNFLRLVLALVVVINHALPLAAFRVVGGVNGTGFGEIAVYGFFGISGFLITGSALRNRAGRYLWQRFLRIFPAFWVCLVVTAFIFGVVAWLHHPPTPHCGISCYFDAPSNSPFAYIYRNLLLVIHQHSIAGTPTGSLIPYEWNGSLWSLSYEFLCYLILMGLALIRLLHRRGTILILTVLLWGTVSVITFTPSLDDKFTLFENYTLYNVLKLTTIFMVGSIIYLYKERVPDSVWLALACTVVLVACFYLPNGGRRPAFTFTTSGLMAPLIAYSLLWLGIHLPLQRVGRRNDYSYGMYIYGFPVAQLLVIWGVQRWGLYPYALMTVFVTVALAMASWWVVEKHTLRLKRLAMSPRAPAEPATDQRSPSDDRDVVTTDDSPALSGGDSVAN